MKTFSSVLFAQKSILISTNFRTYIERINIHCAHIAHNKKPITKKNISVYFHTTWTKKPSNKRKTKRKLYAENLKTKCGWVKWNTFSRYLARYNLTLFIDIWSTIWKIRESLPVFSCYRAKHTHGTAQIDWNKGVEEGKWRDDRNRVNWQIKYKQLREEKNRNEIIILTQHPASIGQVMKMDGRLTNVRRFHVYVLLQSREFIYLTTLDYLHNVSLCVCFICTCMCVVVYLEIWCVGVFLGNQ